jgi:hypothetical protein
VLFFDIISYSYVYPIDWNLCTDIHFSASAALLPYKKSMNYSLF